MFDFLINSLALYRIIRLIQQDTIFDTPREWLTTHSPKWFYELWSCPWCISIWLAPIVFLADRYGYFWWHPIAIILALAAIAAWLMTVDNELT